MQLTLEDLKKRPLNKGCPECGEVHDRDLNAAINILKEGERIIGSRRPEFTLAESPTVDDRQAEPDLRSSDSLKQEAETEKL